MIRFLQHDTIDKLRWDDCISHSVNGNLNAWSWFLDIVCPGWCALVEDDYKNVFPLPTFTRAGIHYMMQPYFTQQLGLFYRSNLPTDTLQNFLNHIPPVYRYIDINLNTSNRVEPGRNITAMTNLELSLSSSYEQIAKGYQNNLHRNLKKAGEHNLTLTKSISPEELITLFRENKGLELKHLGEKQYNLILQIANGSLIKGTGEIWGAYDELNQLSAGVLWVKSHGKAIFLFSAVSGKGKQLNAMPWLIDLFIRENAGKPLTLDFEGSNHPGLARFYSSFGAKKTEYQRYRYNSLPLIYRIAMYIWRLSRKALKKIIVM